MDMGNKTKTERERIYYPLADAATALHMSADELLHCAAFAQIELLTPVPNNDADGFDLSARAVFTTRTDTGFLDVRVVDDLTLSVSDGGMYFYGLSARVCSEIEKEGLSCRSRFHRCYRVNTKDVRLDDARVGSVVDGSFPHRDNSCIDEVRSTPDADVRMDYFLEDVHGDGVIGLDITRAKLFVSGDEVRRFKANAPMDIDKRQALTEPLQEGEDKIHGRTKHKYNRVVAGLLCELRLRGVPLSAVAKVIETNCANGELCHGEAAIGHTRVHEVLADAKKLLINSQ
jgi:hypothetical protein